VTSMPKRSKKTIDPELIRRAQEGDASAKEELWEACQSSLKGFGKKFHQLPPEEFERIKVDAFCKALNAYDPSYGTQFTTYLYFKLRRENFHSRARYFSQKNQLRREKEGLSLDRIEEVLENDEGNPFSTSLRDLVLPTAEIEELNELEIEVTSAFFEEDLPFEEIADKHNISISKVIEILADVLERLENQEG